MNGIFLNPPPQSSPIKGEEVVYASVRCPAFRREEFHWAYLSRIKSVIYGFSSISRPMVEVGVSP